jgi:PAS domain S-box-containing protein
MKRLLIERWPDTGLQCRPLLRRVALPMLLLWLINLIAPVAANAAQKNVLILSGGRGRVSINQMESSLRAHFSAPVNFSIVDLENPQFAQKTYQDNFAEALRTGYAREIPDLMVAVSDPALQFAAKYRDKMFPGVPIVFMSQSMPLPEKMWPEVTGVSSTSGISETIDLALRLQPDTQVFAVVTDVVGADKNWLLEEQAELLRRRNRVREIDIIGPANPETLQKVAELPPHSVVLFQLYPHDSNQPAFGALDVLAAISPRVPTYSILPPNVGRGAIASVSYDPTPDAVLAGELAARVLSGERAGKIPIVRNSNLITSVDWRELRHWNIPESAIPPGVQILFREPTLWEQGRKYFLAGIAVIVIQSLLIFALFWHRTRRRKAEVDLERSEQKFSKAFRRSPLAISIVTARDDHYVDVNEAFETQTGWTRVETIGRSPHELNLWVDLDQRASFLKQLVGETNVRDLEVKLRRKDGQIRTTLGSAELIDVHGEPCVLSVFADVTERKQAEEAMAGFSRRLIEAQETERTRIARELHDDINQRLALIAISLKSAKKSLASAESKTSRMLDEAGERVSELGNDIQALSHRLHSSKLEYLGLEAAISGFCRELSEGENVKIDLHFDNVPGKLSSEVSLCLFRVLQEALHNAAKYSGVDEFAVSLTGMSDRLELSVHDSGAGFDFAQANNGRGLGLTSMKERLRIVRGELIIDSKRGQGTTVIARVPLDSHSQTPNQLASKCTTL